MSLFARRDSWQRLRATSMLGRMRDDRRGSIQIMTALVIVPLVISVAFAIDYSRVMNVRSQMQAAADAAALGARVSGSDANATAASAAQAFAKANARDMAGVEIKSLDVASTSDGFRVEMTARVPTPALQGTPPASARAARASVRAGSPRRRRARGGAPAGARTS